MEPIDRRVILGAAGLAGVAAFSKLAGAGPLTPPPGPVASTGKTLTEVEPRIAINAANTPGSANAQFRITAPGSYYLTGNITGEAGKSAIEIASSHVSLDLMGFALLGVPGSLSGVLLTIAGATNISVRNGAVSGFSESGVQLFDPFRAEGCLLENIEASGNGAMGIGAGVNAVVRACLAHSNGDTGIAAGNNSSIEGCVAQANSGRGFLVGLTTTIRGCSALENLADGFTLTEGAVSDCIARGNTGEGFQLSSSTATNCTSNQNGASGFFAEQGGVVAGCVASFNGQHGVRAEGGCVVASNTCRSNGGPSAGAGVHVSGDDTRVEGNSCVGNHYGVRVLHPGNIVLRNTCSGGAVAFEIAAGNRYGPIVNITAATAPAVSGNNAAGVLATTDPWANLVF